jgi:sugar O-acyltransferase (sialic acid O-acetyltransferase NeuD family)
MNDPLFILGTGGHAHDIAEIASVLGRRPVFVTRDADERRAWSGIDEIVLEDEVVSRRGAEFAIGIGDNQLRARVAATHAQLHFPALIHSDSSFGRAQRAVLAEQTGTIVFAGVRFTSGISVGAFCTFNLNTTVSHDCDIGDFVNLSPGAHVAGNVRIGSRAWIGLGAVVNQGNAGRKVEIGANTVIGSGAVVLGDCAADSVYVGVPARKIR